MKVSERRAHRYRHEDDERERPSSFAPARRGSREEIEAAITLLARHQVLGALLEAADVLAMILDAHRQILFASRDLLTLRGVKSSTDLEGLRPGEALGCVHAWENPAGCGTSPHCASCGAAIAILGSQQADQPVSRECLLTLSGPSGPRAAEFQARAAPLRLNGSRFTVFSLRDLSAEKRRRALEQVFFHDVLNTVSALHGYAELLKQPGIANPGQLLERFAGLTERLRREILDQRALLQAEAGTLVIQRERLLPSEVLDLAEQLYAGQAAREDKPLRVRCDESAAGELHSDRSLLLRVLSNMIKNALEASARGQEIRLNVDGDSESCTFHVWNASAMPSEVSRQIFTRSFSTKASVGRGLGTYSMKLFGEAYLGGRIAFSSAEGEGTEFSIVLPRR